MNISQNELLPEQFLILSEVDQENEIKNKDNKKELLNLFEDIVYVNSLERKKIHLKENCYNAYDFKRFFDFITQYSNLKKRVEVYLLFEKIIESKEENLIFLLKNELMQNMQIKNVSFFIQGDGRKYSLSEINPLIDPDYVANIHDFHFSNFPVKKSFHSRLTQVAIHDFLSCLNISVWQSVCHSSNITNLSLKSG